MKKPLDAHLRQLHERLGIPSQGSLGMVLHVTRRCIERGLPLDPERLTTGTETRVAGLSGTRVDKILREHGVSQSLGTEVGRTSPGTLMNTRKYLLALNEMYSRGQLAVEDLPLVEAHWVEQTRLFFASEPMRLRLDKALSIHENVSDLFSQAQSRQSATPGVQFVGGLLHYLVGAKLRLIAGSDLSVRSYSAADRLGEAIGDYEHRGLIFHVTSHQTPGVILKCLADVKSGRRPIIVTLRERIGDFNKPAGQAGILERVEIWDAIQFISTNAYEDLLSGANESREATLSALIEEYNRIIEGCEKDPRFRIQIT